MEKFIEVFDKKLAAKPTDSDWEVVRHTWGLFKVLLLETTEDLKETAAPSDPTDTAA